MAHTPVLEGIRQQNPNLLGSGKMVAITECLMGIPVEDRSTVDKIATICATSDGFVMGMLVGDIGYNEFLGPFSDLERNVRGLAAHFDAPREADYLLDQIRLAGIDS
jgi:hypothetical protein